MDIKVYIGLEGPKKALEGSLEAYCQEQVNSIKDNMKIPPKLRVWGQISLYGHYWMDSIAVYGHLCSRVKYNVI